MKKDYVFANDDWFKKALIKLEKPNQERFIEYLYAGISDLFNDDGEIAKEIQQQKQEIDLYMNKINDMYHLSRTALEHFDNLAKYVEEHQEFVDSQLKLLIQGDDEKSASNDGIVELFKEVFPVKIRKCINNLAACSWAVPEEVQRKEQSDRLYNWQQSMKRFYGSFKEAAGLLVIIYDAPKKYQKLIIKLTRQEYAKAANEIPYLKNHADSYIKAHNKDADFFSRLNEDMMLVNSGLSVFKEIERRVKKDPNFDPMSLPYFKEMNVPTSQAKSTSGKPIPQKYYPKSTI